MTKAGSTNISCQKKTTDPRSSRGAAVRAFFYVTEKSFSTGRIYYTMHPPARTNPCRRCPREDPCWSHLDESRVGGFGEGNSSVDFGDRGFRDKDWGWFKRVRGGLRMPFSPTSWPHQGASESIGPTYVLFSLVRTPSLADSCARNPFLSSLVLSCLSLF